jgi:protein tyrosine phosphatase
MEKQGSGVRHITQFHYTGWMDYGVPDNPLGTLQLIQLADRAQRRFESTTLNTDTVIGPMVIHCSAGCGRSGAFCAIDTVLRRLKSATAADDYDTDALWEIIFRFREQRLSMVQTLRQFVFCYEVVWWWFLGYGRQLDGMDF